MKMAKKKNNADGELTIEELEAIEAERAKNKKKKDENPDVPPDTGPATPPTIPDNPGNPNEDMPTDNTDTVIVIGDPANPEIIVISNEPDPLTEAPVASPESDSEPLTNTGGTDGNVSRSNA
jgi:hypothetical protein